MIVLLIVCYYFIIVNIDYITLDSICVSLLLCFIVFVFHCFLCFIALCTHVDSVYSVYKYIEWIVYMVYIVYIVSESCLHSELHCNSSIFPGPKGLDREGV